MPEMADLVATMADLLNYMDKNIDNENNITIQPSDTNELINIVNLVFELYKLDPTYLKKKLKKLNVDMKMYSSLYDNSNRTIILKALSFYDHMKSNKKIQVIENDKARQTHKESLKRASDYYEIDSNELQTWIGRRNGFAGKKI